MLGEYHDILGKAWDFTKRYRSMWWFGLFAAFLGGNGGEYELFVQHFFDLQDKKGFYSILDPGSVSERWEVAQRFFSEAGAAGWVGALVVAIIALFFIWIVMISQSALVHAVGRKIPARGMTFDKMFSAGREFWVKTFALNLTAKAAILILFLIVAWPITWAMRNDPSTGLRVGLDIVVFFLLVPGAIIISFLTKYAMSFAILKNKTIGESIKSSWKLFTEHWLVTAELSLLVFALNVLMGLGMVVILAIFTLPIYFLAGFIAGAGLTTAFWILVFITAIIFFSIIFMFGAAFSTFQWAAWTFLFVELTKKKRESILARWIRALFPRTSARLSLQRS